MMEQQYLQVVPVMAPDQAEEIEAAHLLKGLDLPEEIFNSIVIKQWDLVILGLKHFKERWKK